MTNISTTKPPVLTPPPPPAEKSLLYLDMVANDIACLSGLLHNLLKEQANDQETEPWPQNISALENMTKPVLGPADI